MEKNVCGKVAHGRICLLGLAAAVLLCFAGHVASQQADVRITPLESLVPAETLVYFSVCDLAKAKESFKQTALWKIWKDEEVQFAYESIVKNFQKDIDKMEAEFEREVGEKLETLLELLDGQISFALIGHDPQAERNDRSPVKLAFAVDVKEKKDVAQRLLSHIEEKSRMPTVLYDCPGEHAGCVREPSPGKCPMCGKELVEREELPRELSISDVTVEDLQFKMVDEKPSLYYGFLGNTLIGVTEEALLKDFVARFKSGNAEGSLTRHAGYKDAKTRVGGGDPTYIFYAASADELIARAREGTEIDEEADRVIEALGVRSIGGLAIGATIQPDGMFSEAVYLMVKGARKGITKLAEFIKPCDIDLAMTPPNAMGAATARIDFQGLYTEAMEIVKGCAGEAWPMIDEEIQEFEDEAGVSIEKDIVGSLGGRGHMYFVPMDGGGLLPAGVFVVDMADSTRFEKAFASLATYGGVYEVKTIPFKGREIKYMSRLPERPRPAFSELDAGVAVARTQIETFQLVIDNYRIVEGNLPADLQALVPNYIEELPLDPWGNSYAYKVLEDGGFEVTSYGADGVAGGEEHAGDITNLNDVGRYDFPEPMEREHRGMSEERMFGLLSLTSVPNCYFIEGHRCFMSTMSQNLKDVIRAFETGILPASPQSHPLKGMVSSIPRGVALPAYSDLCPFVGSFYNTLVQGLTIAEPFIEASEPMPVQIDAATLPSSAAITQYVKPQLAWLEIDDAGFTYRAMSSTCFTTIGIGTAAILAAVVVPIVQRSRGVAEKVACMSNLKQIGMCMFIYQSQYGEGQDFPPGTGRQFLKNLLILPAPERAVCSGMEVIFKCKHGDPFPPDGISYRGPAEEVKNPNAMPADTPLACDSPMNHPDGTINVLYLDGHVEKHYPGTPEYNRVMEMTKE